LAAQFCGSLELAETADVTYWRLFFVDTSKNLTPLPKTGRGVAGILDGGTYGNKRSSRHRFARRSAQWLRGRVTALWSLDMDTAKEKMETLRSDRRSATETVVRQWATSLTLEEMAAKRFETKKMTLYTVSLYDMICFILLGAFPIAYLCTRERKEVRILSGVVRNLARRR
jgi:hypothetical protein